MCIADCIKKPFKIDASAQLSERYRLSSGITECQYYTQAVMKTVGVLGVLGVFSRGKLRDYWCHKFSSKSFILIQTFLLNNIVVYFNGQALSIKGSFLRSAGAFGFISLPLLNLCASQKDAIMLYHETCFEGTWFVAEVFSHFGKKMPYGFILLVKVIVMSIPLSLLQ